MVFRFVETRTLRQYFEIGKFGEAKLRCQLSRPLYRIQPDRKVLWNLELVRDYLLHGGDTPEHQRLIEEYLSTLEPTGRNLS